MRCGQYEFRRHRNRLYLLSPVFEPVQSFRYGWSANDEELLIPELKLVLKRTEAAAQGLLIPPAAQVEVRSRKGGELIAVGDPLIHKSVKKLLQEADVPEWQRGGIPLIYVNGDLAAVWKIIVSQHYLKAGFPGSALQAGPVAEAAGVAATAELAANCLLYTSPSPRDATLSRMPSSA